MKDHDYDPIPRKRLSDEELKRRYYEGELDAVTAQLYVATVGADATKSMNTLGATLNKIENSKEGARGGKRGAVTRQEDSATMRVVIRDKFDELQRRYPHLSRSQLVKNYLIPGLKDNETQLMEEHGVKKVVYSKSTIYTFLK